MSITIVRTTGRTPTEKTAAFITPTSTPVRWVTWYAALPPHSSVNRFHLSVSAGPCSQPSCSDLQTSESICGPWIPDDGKIFTHTISTSGKMTQTNWTAKVTRQNPAG